MAKTNGAAPHRLRSRRWFDDPADPGMTALYIERYMNYGITREELQSDKPVIGIAQTGSDLSPCNRHHIELATRVRDGIRDAGGIPMEFPLHPIQETGKRPTAALDRNLAYLGLVEVLHGYPIDGVVLTTGCDKTTPACLMGAATVNIPAIVLSGGPMLDGWWKGRLSGSGTIIWEARKLLAEGKIKYDEFMDMVSSSAPSIGHCNTMGTATSMNSLAEALGMSLPGCAAIPAPYRERGWMAYETGKRIVGMVAENLRPSDIMTKDAFENAVVAAAALGASSNCPISMIAIARHMGIDHDLDDWQRLGPEIPLLVDLQPAGRFLSNPDRPNVFEGRAIVFEGPEDYHARIEDPSLEIEEQSVLVIRNCGPVGYPGSAEVVNMQPPAALLKKGINALPTMGDGRQSGTSAAPSILNVSPEAAVGGGLALLKTGDRIRIDLNTRKVDVLLPEGELSSRRAAWRPAVLQNKTPWEEIYRSMVGQMGTGACLEPATLYLNIVETRGESRNNH